MISAGGQAGKDTLAPRRNRRDNFRKKAEPAMPSNPTAAERRVLTMRPDTKAIVFQFRNLAKLAAAAALLLPGPQAVIAKSVWIAASGRIALTKEMMDCALYLPSGLLLLWFAARFFYQRTCSFTLTDERLIVRYGVLLRVEDEIELYRVVDVAQTVGLVQRLLGVGNVFVSSTDRTGNVVLPLVREPSKVRNSIRTQAERCKSRRGSVRILE
jgi:membrane protein YdbS with pleckstrin-like domain